MGGSGTRAVALILQKLGVYQGKELNPAQDNLLFTRLFRNPEWYRRATSQDIAARFELFKRCMKGDALSLRQYVALCKAAHENPTRNTSLAYQLRKLSTLRSSKHRPIWGWKEPNTQFYASELLATQPSLRYVHVLRHGLDMAYSTNTRQLRFWGWKYGISTTGEEQGHELAAKMLRYWISSTQEIIATSNVYPGRVLLINFTNLCLQPEVEIERLLRFCQLSPPESLLPLSSIPRQPRSNSRYMQHDWRRFPKEQLAYVQSCGFDLDDEH